MTQTSPTVISVSPIWYGPNIIEAEEGQLDFNVTCSVCGNPPPPTALIKWTFHPLWYGQESSVIDMVASLQGDIINFYNITEFHYGYYTCEVMYRLDSQSYGFQKFTVKLQRLIGM